MSPTPGCVYRSRAISPLTLWPGSCPPSPGFEPCAILMLSSSAYAQYSGVTPKRPDAICLIRELRSRAVPRVRKRAGSSPPSPQLLLPPIMFIAIASVSCASAESAPCDIAPVEKRRVIASTGSTSSIGTGSLAGTSSSRSCSSVDGSRLDEVAEPPVEVGALLGDGATAGGARHASSAGSAGGQRLGRVSPSKKMTWPCSSAGATGTAANLAAIGGGPSRSARRRCALVTVGVGVVDDEADRRVRAPRSSRGCSRGTRRRACGTG